jgi:acyl-CoA synthetase (NDP forming)
MSGQHTSREAIGRLLRPKSLAIVGASDRVGPGFNAWLALERVKYAGEVHLIHPAKRELLGRPTYRTLDDVPSRIDAVFIAVPRAAVLDAVRAAGRKGAGGAVVLSSGFGEAGPDGVAAQRELVDIAARHDMAVAGPNCLGYLNFAGQTAAFGTTLPDRLPLGGVAAIAQSGAISIALLNCGRDIGLSALITTGNEAVTTVSDYVDYLVDDPGVTALIAFIEQLRKPALFLDAARRARSLGKPLIVVKTGRSERGRAAVMAHTGAVAGNDEVCDAAFRATGVIRVGSLDELVEMAVLVANAPRRPQVPGVAIMSSSGGEIALALDVAEAAGLDLPAVTGAAAERLREALPEFAHVTNPLDLTWSGLYDPTVARRCADALASLPDVGTLVLLQDAPRAFGEQQAARYANLLRAVADAADARRKPLVSVTNLGGELSGPFQAVAAEAGVPCLRGTQPGLYSVARFARWACVAPREPSPGSAARDAARDRARAEWQRTNPATALAEHEARRVVAAYGIAQPRERFVEGAVTPGAIIEAAEAIGFPVVLKGIVAGVAHKTEAGLVVVGVAGVEAARLEAGALIARAAKTGGALLGVLVQEQVRPVAELLVGARVDPEFGPVIVAGGGGVMVELYRDVAVRLAPVGEDEAREMIAQTKAAALLGGWRGKPRGDVDAAARAVARLSELVADFAGDVVEVEVNPLGVLAEGRGAVALDCLIVPRGASATEEA